MYLSIPAQLRIMQCLLCVCSLPATSTTKYNGNDIRKILKLMLRNTNMNSSSK